jgi:cytochrome c553
MHCCLAKLTSRMSLFKRRFDDLALAAIALLVMVAAARASEESVDQTTKIALSLDAHVKHGRALFIAQCASCHGRTGYGDSSRSIPALAGQRFAYIVRQLANFSGDERESETMHHVVDRVSMRGAQAWADVAAYVSRLPVNPAAETGDGTHLALGRGIFREQCASCHQPDAAGDQDGLVPALKGQHYSYLLGQLRQLAADRRHNVDEDLQRFIQSLDEQDKQAVADYLSRQHAPGKNHQVMRQDGTLVD